MPWIFYHNHSIEETPHFRLSSPPTFPSMQCRLDRKFRLELTYKAARQAGESERCVAGVNLPRPRWDEPGDMTARAGIYAEGATSSSRSGGRRGARLNYVTAETSAPQETIFHTILMQFYHYYFRGNEDKIGESGCDGCYS